MISDLEILEKAREYFIEHGGAIGEFRNENKKICATEAVIYFIRREKIWGMEILSKLNQSSIELFGRGIIYVNDKIGIQAVIDVYDHCIKNMKENINE